MLASARFLYIPPIRLAPARAFHSAIILSSGHNKWSKIKEKKGVNDAAKGAIYGKANKDILVAIRQGGSADPEQNAMLATVLKRAKAQGIPKDNIEKALKKASGGGEKAGQAVTYEAIAAGTVGIIIECLTDNVNRTLHSLRDVLGSHGGRFAPVGFQFERKGSVIVTLDDGEDIDACTEKLIEAGLEAGADDFTQEDPSDGVVEIQFLCQPNMLATVTGAVTAPGVSKELISSELIYAPVEPPDSVGEDTENKISRLVQELEDNEDTLRVWTTLDT